MYICVCMCVLAYLSTHACKAMYTYFLIVLHQLLLVTGWPCFHALTDVTNKQSRANACMKCQTQMLVLQGFQYKPFENKLS